MSQPALDHLCAADTVLARLIKQVGPCGLKPRRRRQPFEALVSAVTHQQLNGTAAATILNRVIALFPGKRFPAPADLAGASEERLRSAGLSCAKAAAIKDIAEKTLSGVVPDLRTVSKMGDAEIIGRLTRLRGVGPWTVEMLLMFTLGRPDVLPVTDFGVRKGFALAYGLREMPAPKELLAHGERWRPHRSVAAWYLWRAVDLPPEVTATFAKRSRS